MMKLGKEQSDDQPKDTVRLVDPGRLSDFQFSRERNTV